MVRRTSFVFAVASALVCQLPRAYAAGDVVAGKALFLSLTCASCHAVGPDARSGFGPQLNGIFGRVAGSSPDYKERYSAAMKKSGIVWSEQSLTKFLNSPGNVVPGTKMSFWGISDEKKLANLLAYLRSFPVDPK
ncbi:cytochrome c family protein [Herbaspirillum sp. RTI4]|uniref:cytochrome c family protein n=1 Tax=Herbaspirillum sp. RTI4 TaxID=3048640 RepID=UPI002AB435FD|nr:cytochrome c family protein [Herbaspirillum sp. RTI4]MDY7579951.1 cytochrome c family protein [Herbaspirillum sp. RTI4]MEA9982905.1 cytochrome c family protein [Herbaspirillum sp. RTI4]